MLKGLFVIFAMIGLAAVMLCGESITDKLAGSFPSEYVPATVAGFVTLTLVGGGIACRKKIKRFGREVCDLAIAINTKIQADDEAWNRQERYRRRNAAIHASGAEIAICIHRPQG